MRSETRVAKVFRMGWERGAGEGFVTAVEAERLLRDAGVRTLQEDDVTVFQNGVDDGMAGDTWRL